MSKYSEFVDKSLPKEKKAKVSRCIVGYYFVRPVCNIVSMPLVKTDISPTTITKISCVFALIGYLAFTLVPENIGFWVGWLCIYIWNVLDGVDGIIARYNNKCSKIGELWDAAVGWIAVIVFYAGMGHIAYSEPGFLFQNTQINNVIFLILGYLASICFIFPRLILQKKNVLLGDEAVKNVKARENYGTGKLKVFNLTSINGLASVLFLLSYLFHILGICTICYFILNFAIMIGSLYSLLKEHK